MSTPYLFPAVAQAFFVQGRLCKQGMEEEEHRGHEKGWYHVEHLAVLDVQQVEAGGGDKYSTEYAQFGHQFGTDGRC